ncbi:uncharacterized protein LOC135503417 [Lineus longissimus]|uniref:uncharacterized protein LOC135503417 n=1 Tax=Lineus longissimus TaxID=88925 RepID=UPI002B4F3029
MPNLHMFITSVIRMKFARRSALKDKHKELKPCLGYANCCVECAKHTSDTLVWEPETLNKSAMGTFTSPRSNLQPIEMDLLASVESEKPRKRLQRESLGMHDHSVHGELTRMLRSLSSVMHFKSGELEDDQYGPNGKVEVNVKRAWGSTRVKQPNGVLVGAGAGVGKLSTPRNPRTKRVPVEVRVAFIKVIDVDTLKQRFKADVFIQAKWEEPALKGFTQEELDKSFQPEDYWNPDLFVPNIQGHPERDDTWYVTSTKEARHNNPVIFMRRRIKAFFNERMELRDFPLDVQELHVKIASRRKETVVELTEDLSCLSVVNLATFTDANEFSLYKHVECSNAIMNSKLPQDTKKHPLLEFNISVKRNTGFFFWNVVFPMFLISGMMFATYGIDRKKYDERIKVNVLLILSIVALKFVVSKGLPKIPYMTYVDAYVLVSLIVVMMMACQNAILSFYKDDATRMQSFDTGSVWFFLVIYLLIQIICGALLGIKLSTQKMEMDKKEKDYMRKKKYSDRHMLTEGDFSMMAN